jgi:hypothetical protein
MGEKNERGDTVMVRHRHAQARSVKREVSEVVKPFHAAHNQEPFSFDMDFNLNASTTI